MGNELNSITKFVIAGTTGVGKTTLIKETIGVFPGRVGGFLTERLMENGALSGFQLRVISGPDALLASRKLSSKTRINKYGVDVKSLTTLAAPALAQAEAEGKVVIIDEIGPMLMASPRLSALIIRLLAGPALVLATIRKNAEPFTKQFKKMSETKLLDLTKENRFETKRALRAWMDASCRP